MGAEMPKGSGRSVLDGLEGIYEGAAAQWDSAKDYVTRVAPGAGGSLKVGGVTLRPAVPATSPAPRLKYLADLQSPALTLVITTRAAKPGYAYINPYPASGVGVRTSVPELKAGMKRLLAGDPLDRGPHVTFRNDIKGAQSPNQPWTSRTAGMIAAAILDSGVLSVNINSTTGGHTRPDQKDSNHNAARAVDINRVNGLKVGVPGKANSDPNALAAVAALQNAYRRQPNIRENFGPTFQEKAMAPGQAAARTPSQRAGHQNHVHGSGQR